MIYFDNAAFHPILPSVMSKTTELMYKLANPSSLHKAGVAMKEEIEKARVKVAEAIHCNPEEVVFISGATEGNHLMMQSMANNLTLSMFEHSSMDETMGIPYTHEEIESGKVVEVDEYGSHILVDSETGTNFEDWVATKARSSDITAAIGNIPVDVKKLGLEAATFSGEKIGGFSGTGVWYASNTEIGLCSPLIGGHQEKGLRGGTENILGIVSIGIAIEEAMNNMVLKNHHCSTLKNTLLYELKKKNFDFIVNGQHQIPAICSVSFKGIEGAALANYLDAHDICVSTGSACNSGSMEPSTVLRSFGVPSDYINGTIRFSFGLQNTVGEVKQAVGVIEKFINR